MKRETENDALRKALGEAIGWVRIAAAVHDLQRHPEKVKAANLWIERALLLASDPEGKNG